MAGDWIKIEKVTPRKPEVLHLADILGVTPDHAFGLCFRFWSWVDDNLLTGHVQNVTNVTLDLVIGHAGFSSALIKVGWLVDRQGALQVPNFDRHLSQGSKLRALAKDRKAKERSRTKRDKSVTREEKRRIKRERERARDPTPVVEAHQNGQLPAALGASPASSDVGKLVQEIVAMYPGNGNRYEAARCLLAAINAGECAETIRANVRRHVEKWNKLTLAQQEFCPCLHVYFGEARWRDNPDGRPWTRHDDDTPTKKPKPELEKRPWE